MKNKFLSNETEIIEYLGKNKKVLLNDRDNLEILFNLIGTENLTNKIWDEIIKLNEKNNNLLNQILSYLIASPINNSNLKLSKDHINKITDLDNFKDYQVIKFLDLLLYTDNDKLKINNLETIINEMVVKTDKRFFLTEYANYENYLMRYLTGGRLQLSEKTVLSIIKKSNLNHLQENNFSALMIFVEKEKNASMQIINSLVINDFYVENNGDNFQLNEEKVKQHLTMELFIADLEGPGIDRINKVIKLTRLFLEKYNIEQHLKLTNQGNLYKL